MLFFSIVITLSLYSLTSLDLLLNMENLKFSIFQDHMETSTLSLLTSVHQKALFFDLKILGDTSVLSFTGNYFFINILVFTPIKLFFTIKSIKCWKTQFRDYFFIKNDFSIEHAFFLSYSMDFFCGSFASLAYPLKELRKIQQRATIWITGTFHTLPTWGIKAITELILIYLHIQKISRRHQLCISSLSTNHVINFILQNRHAKNSPTYCLSLENITIKQ